MINFCIISTDQNTIDSFLTTIQKTLFPINEKEQVKIVPSFEEYAKQENTTDVLILDLETNPIKDIKEINNYKKLSNGRDLKIILVSNSDEYVIPAFEYGITGFILKPVNESSIETFIQKATIELYKSGLVNRLDRSSSIVLKNGDVYERVSLSDIAYIEVIKHDIFYNIYKNGVPDKVIRNRGTLKQERSKLPSNIFASSGINCMINTKYITKIANDTVYLGDTKIHISRSYRKEILSAFKDYYKY